MEVDVPEQVMPSEPVPSDPRMTTLDAYADTVLPGAAAAGAVELLEQPGGGLAPTLDALVAALNEHAAEYAAARDVRLDPALPAFVALDNEDRTTLVRTLVAPGHPEKQLWVGLALFSYMAFDSAAHISTAEALATGHPGLTLIGFRRPDEDGWFRFPRFSYGRRLAEPHPRTTETGSPE